MEPPFEAAFFMCAEHVRQLGGVSPLLNSTWWRWRVSEAQGRSGDGRSEGSAEQKREPMNKNRIWGIRCRMSRQLTAKSISIKGTGCKFGGCARKAVELISGDLPFVPKSGPRRERWLASTTLIIPLPHSKSNYLLLRLVCGRQDCSP